MDKVAGLKKKAAKLRSAPKPKDQRPLSDASFLKDQLTIVFKYLVTHHYTLPISVTQLQSQGKQEVWSALSFVLQRIHSEKFVRSFAELPGVARDVGYPYAVASGPTTANHQATLGFLFWLCDLIRVMDQKVEESGDPVTLYLLSSYGAYLDEPDEDKRVAERCKLFAQMQSLHSQGQFEKVELGIEAEKLEACRKATPLQQLEQLEADIEHFEVENQTYLMEVLAPLDETRNQLRAAAMQPPQHLRAQLDATLSAIAALELQSEALTTEYSNRVQELQAAGLAEVSESFATATHRQSQEQLQELEHEYLSLSAQLDLLTERKTEAQKAQAVARRQLICSLQQRLTEAQEQRVVLEEVLASQEALHTSAVSAAQSALREDVAFVQMHLPVLSV